MRKFTQADYAVIGTTKTKGEKMSKKMTDAQVKKHWGGLQKRHRAEIAEVVVTLYLPGRSNGALATLLDFSEQWVVRQFDVFALSDCVQVQMGGPIDGPPRLVGATWKAGSEGADKQRDAILQEHRNKIRKQDGYDVRKEEIREQFIVDLGLDEKNTHAADRLAESYLAAESAIESGQIVVDKENNKAKLQPTGKPSPPASSFAAKFAKHADGMQKLIHLLDNAKPRELSQSRVQVTVAELASDWQMVVELVGQYSKKESV